MQSGRSSTVGARSLYSCRDADMPLHFVVYVAGSYAGVPNVVLDQIVVTAARDVEQVWDRALSAVVVALSRSVLGWAVLPRNSRNK